MFTTVDYLFALLGSFLVAMFITPGVLWFAKKFKIVDHPDGDRKLHHKPTALLGGLAIFLAFIIVVALFYYGGSNLINSKVVLSKHLLGIIIGAGILMFGGFLDDKYKLPAKVQIIFPIMAVLSVIISGIGIDRLANPVTDNIVLLDEFKYTILWFHGLPYRLTILSDLFTIVWLLAMMYTTKLLDGLDGLVSGISIVGALIIFVTSQMVGVAQPEIALLSMILAGALIGFWLFNFNPARIFLGEGGSLLCGFLLGVLSIMSGSKVAVTLLVVALPACDFIWTIMRRLLSGQNPFTTADRKHLHHRLLGINWTAKKVVIVYYSVSVILGVAAILLQKVMFGLIILALLSLIIFISLLWYANKHSRAIDNLLKK